MANLPVRSGGRGTAVINPSREFEDIYDRMGELMNLAFGLAPVQLADAAWTPLADLSETDDAYIVKVDLPGVRKDQVQVQVQDRQLSVTGEIPEQQDGDGRRIHRRSRRTGRFELHTYLPGEVNSDAVQAELADGVLTVTVPKAEAAKPHKVEITG
ncbi:MAG TPA: Hsp20/alpha crystallin family protein [Trebonia sp.]|jgi:HSP20 family protein|nr:Hsp20/alpha crystallin family protein [Trebonia sp.]